MSDELQTPQDDRLAAATRALRDRATMPQAPDSVIERAMLIPRLGEVNLWRLPSALAAGIALAIGLAWMIFGQRGATVAFADVVQKLKQTHTYILTITTSGMPSMRVVTKNKIVRMEMQDSVTISNEETGKTLNLYPSAHEAVLSQLPMDKIKLQAARFGGMFRDLVIGKEKRIGEKVIDGRLVVGFELPMSNAFPALSGSTSVYWIDPDTKLPIEMELHQNGPPVLDVHETCQFDVPVDDALFDMTPPAGYHLRDLTADSSTKPSLPLTTQQTNDLTITPLVGIGPLHFGDNREKIVAAFGEPDKDSVPETHLRAMPFKMPEIHQMEYHSRGLILTYNADSGLACVMCVGRDATMAAYSAFTGKTDKGIGIGSSRAQIEAAYGPASKADVVADQVRLDYGGLGLMLIINSDRLNIISAFSTPLPF